MRISVAERELDTVECRVRGQIYAGVLRAYAPQLLDRRVVDEDEEDDDDDD